MGWFLKSGGVIGLHNIFSAREGTKVEVIIYQEEKSEEDIADWSFIS